MKEQIAKRLKQARKDAGYDSTRAAAEAYGWTHNTYKSHENGIRGVPLGTLQQYARAYRKSLTWLLTGRGAAALNGKLTAPVVGYVGAGEVVLPIDDYPIGQGFEHVDLPEGVFGEDIVAVRIRGDSMRPLRNGWLIFYRRSQDGVPDECVNELCVCQVADGPCLVKEIRRGSKPGLYHLVSWTHGVDILEDQRLDWAGLVLSVKRP